VYVNQRSSPGCRRRRRRGGELDLRDDRREVVAERGLAEEALAGLALVPELGRVVRRDAAGPAGPAPGERRPSVVVARPTRCGNPFRVGATYMWPAGDNDRGAGCRSAPA